MTFVMPWGATVSSKLLVSNQITSWVQANVPAALFLLPEFAQLMRVRLAINRHAH
jgi:hypothetical protein